MKTLATHRRLLIFLAMLLLALTSTLPVISPATPAWADDGSGDDGGDNGEDDGGSGNSGGSGGDNGGDDGGSASGHGDDDEDDDRGGDGGYDDDDDDHDRALHARRSGAAAPLRRVLSHVHRRYGGTVLDARLKSRAGRTWYEIRLLDRNNRLRTITVPASRSSNRQYNFTSGRHREQKD